MGYEKPDIYNQPEAFGLRIFATIEGGSGYDFDIFLVLEDVATGELLWAQDSGCSCPAPFENVTSRDMTEVLTDETWDMFKTDLSEWAGDRSLAEAGELLGKVSKHLAKVASDRRLGVTIVSEGALRDAVARAERAEKALAYAQEQRQLAVTESRKAVEAHKRLCGMLRSLKDEIVLYLDTEAPDRVVTISAKKEQS